MKNFLKSTVLFACIAMLFCACSDDSTDDGIVGSGDGAAVSAPTITEVTPGVSNIFVEWQMAKNCTADQTIITWSNVADTTLYGSHTEEVMPNDTFYTIIRVTTDDDGVDTGIVAGTYALTIANYNSATEETSTVYECEATVYDQTTYADLCPQVVDITYDLERSEATLVWGEVDPDCISVTITYNSTTKLTIPELVTGDQTVLVDAVAEGAYSYVATFCPEGSEDMIYVSSDEDLVLGTNPETPAWVSSKAGNERFIARWTYAAGDLENLESSIITYTSTEDGAEAKSVTVAKEDLVLNTDNEYYYEFTSVAAGEYTLGVSNVKIGGFASEQAYSAANVVVYDYDTFTPPTFASIETGNDGAIITWAGATEDLKSIVVEYYDTDGVIQKNETTQDGALITQTTLQNAQVGSTLQSVKAYMRYTNGLDLLEYTIQVDNVVVPAGSLPVLSSYVVGYADDKSTIKIDWTLIGAEDFEEVRVYYGLSSQSLSDYEYVTADATTDTSYTLTGLDVAEYKVYVASVLAEVVYYCLEPMAISTYGYDTYKDYVTPVPAVTSANDLVTVAWSTEGVSDLYSVTYSYADGTDDDVVVMAENIATPTTFAYVYGETLELTYTVQYQPEGGDGTVTITSEDFVAAIPEQVPAAPTGLAVSEFGYNDSGAYINIAWDASTEAGVSKYYVYTSTDGTFPSGDGVEVTDAEYVFSPSTLGDYTLYVKASTAAGTMSDYASVTALAYDSTYFTEADLPTASIAYSNSAMSIAWSGVNEYSTVATVYKGGVAVETDIAIANGTITTVDCSDVDGDSVTYSYSVTFAPEGGVGSPVVISSGDLTYTIPSKDIVYADGVYEIYTGLGLAAFADIVNNTDTYLATANIEGFEASVSQNTSAQGVLKANVDLSSICSETLGKSWTPMASYAGTFDGGNFQIQNMYINATTANQGFINALTGTIKNVVMYNSTITTTAATNGTIASTASAAALIENCGVIGTSSVYSSANVNGGIVGNLSGVAKNCYTGSEVTVESESGGGTGTSTAAGIAGTASATTAYVVGCHNAATITGKRGTGGLVGYSTNVTIIGSCNTGNIIDTSTGNAGGLGGRFIDGTVKFIGCYNAGQVDVTNTQTAGIVGVCTSTTTLAGVFNVGVINNPNNKNQVAALTGYSVDSFTFASSYYVPAGDVSWGVVSSSTTDPTGVTKAADYAELNAVVDAMNAAIVAAGYGSSSEYYYQFVAGASGAEYPTLVEVVE